ncbi:MAG: hypothetical protein Q9183_001143 [Haloplaca sp. 2 TL-2023]
MDKFTVEKVEIDLLEFLRTQELRQIDRTLRSTSRRRDEALHIFLPRSLRYPPFQDAMIEYLGQITPGFNVKAGTAVFSEMANINGTFSRLDESTVMGKSE